MTRRRSVVFWLAAFLLLGCQGKPPVSNQPPPPKVQVVVARAQQVPLFQEFVGQIFGAEDIAIRARVEGFLEGIHFKEGRPVKKGDLLYTIDSQPFEAEVAAKMSMVAEAKTELVKATSDLNRIRPLAERRAVSRSDLDAAVAHYDAARASVKAAEANLKAARIQLGYTRIVSPINGIIGKTNARVGDFVGRSMDTVVLNEVSNIDSVRVQFFLTENQYLELIRRYTSLKQAGQSEEADEELELILADGATYEHKGRFDFLDRQVDPTTGSILVQASFPNPSYILRPGQFGKVRARIDVVDNAILIPQRCVVERQGRHHVFVVEGDNKVAQRPVTVGPTVGSAWLIRKGLKPEEQVVYEGLQSIRDSIVVEPEIHKPDTSSQKAS